MKTVFICITALAALLFEIYKFRKRKKRFIVPASVKENYIKITVASSAIEIKTNVYYEEIESSAKSITTPDYLSNNSERNITKDKKYLSVLLYEGYKIRSRSILLRSEPIDLSKEEILSYFKKVTTIDIYIDKGNQQLCYFDLSFLS